MTSLGLGQLQTGLLQLIKGRPTAVADSYLSEVARSEALVLLREIAASWRATSIQRTAPLTTAMLERRGYLGAELIALIRAPDLGPFHRDVRNRLFASAANHHDPLVAAVARFERALIGVAEGTLECAIAIEWPVDPYPVLNALMAGRELPATGPASHQVLVGPTVAGMFRVMPS